MAIVIDEFGEDHEASRVCIKMSKAVWVRVWIDLDDEKEYTQLEIEEIAGTVYTDGIQRANSCNVEMEMETISTDYLEVEYE